MGQDRFDALVRVLTTQQPRREALKVLGAAGIATAAGGTLLESARSRKKGKKKKDEDKRCRHGRKKCRGKCLAQGLVCCPSKSAGLGGACPASDPHCCPLSLWGGCCPPEFPKCCKEECCAEGDECDEDGFCTTPD